CNQPLTRDCLDTFKLELHKLITTSWKQWESSPLPHNTTTALSFSSTVINKKMTPPTRLPLDTWLAEFSAHKANESITPLTVHQLKQRITHFIQFYRSLKDANFNTALFMKYIAHLNAEHRSAKTNKEFFASIKQFFKWLHVMEKIETNPAQQIQYKFKSKQHASDERIRWSAAELQQLTQSSYFQSATDSLKWVTMMQLYMGLRPSEACQLETHDVSLSSTIPYIKITDAGEKQHVKNKHAIRTIPIHSMLLQLGFTHYVNGRREKQLFDYEPLNINQDWSKKYRTQFGKLQSKMGMKPHIRPTAYGLRHTFIDTLKQQGIAETQVAEIVGHTNSNMTFGRYGKRLNLKSKLDVVEAFSLNLSEEAL
ncbi:site-specific integrase, partial [Vibrio sp. B1Z05]|uniref:site-specific integrase n=1 Tax=Vibrio sp. B1Z05 TaxID=2654980 RepID=UPI00128D5E23